MEATLRIETIKKKKYYVVTDVHGYYTYLIKALTEAGFFDEEDPAMLIVCGDLLDRGFEANEVVDFMLKLSEEGRLIYVLGNHEDLLVQCLQSIAAGGIYEVTGTLSPHRSNGTWNTLLQLSDIGVAEALGNPNELVRRILSSPFYKKLLPKAVDYFETENYIFTHGWIPCIQEGYRINAKYTYDPDWRNADIELWKKARWRNGMELACRHHIVEEGKTIVCGHFNASYGHAHIENKCSEWGCDADFSPFYGDGVIGLDSSAANSGMINCIVIED